MSAFANQPSAPTIAPESRPPQPRPAVVMPPQRSKWWIAVLILVLLAAGAAWLLRSKPAAQSPAQTPVVRTARVARGTFEKILRIAGTTAATNFANITAPMLRGPESGRGLVLIFLAEPGTYVKKGQIVAQIDAQAAKDHVDDVQAMVDQADADIRKRRAEQAIELENLRQGLREAKANLDKVKADLEAEQIRVDIDREQLKLDLEEAEAQYRELQKDFDTSVASQKAELRVLDLTKLRHQRHMERHQSDLQKFTIRAPMDGLVVMTTLWRAGQMAQIRQGDQVAPRQPFMKIVDTRKMQVDASINQAESESLRYGLQATVGFDAFPDLRVPARVLSIGAMAVSNSRSSSNYIRSIPVRLELLGSDPRIIPDLSASADIVLEKRPDSLIVPRQAILPLNGKPAVYVREGQRFVAQPVEIGATANTQAVVLAGLTAGQVIALQKP